MSTKPTKTPKPVKPAKPHYNWRIFEAAHKILAKDWTLAKDDHQSDVLDRVLAFAGVAKKLASTIMGAGGRPNRARSPAERRHDPI
jgi:hypothetical protein